jgi:hypothetical protein
MRPPSLWVSIAMLPMLQKALQPMVGTKSNASKAVSTSTLETYCNNAQWLMQNIKKLQIFN